MSRRYPEAPLFAVAAVVVREGRVLLVRRRQPPHAGQWSVPGGVQEVGETIADALRREVREETGLEIAVGPLLDLADLLVPDGDGRVEYHYVIAYYRAAPTGGHLRPGDDAEAVRWVTLAEVAGAGLPPRLEHLIGLALTAG